MSARRGIKNKLPGHEVIVGFIKSRVLSGQWEPNQRLPAQLDLQRRFDVTAPIVQKAMGRLQQEGFVYSQSTKGRFVAPVPPHLLNFGLLTPHEYVNPGLPFSMFWVALQQAALNFNAGETCRFPLYNVNIGSHDNAWLARLKSDLKSRKLGGLILPPILEPHVEPLTAEFPWLKCVVLSAAHAKPTPCVYPDLALFLARSLDFLAQRNRRRVALLSVGHARKNLEALLIDMLQTRKMATKTYWIQYLTSAYPETVRRVTHLLFANAADRPDGLIIDDDHLLEPAQAGLLDAGVKAGADVEIIAHANFPFVKAPVLPIARLGFSAAAVLLTARDVIMRQRQNGSRPEFTGVPPVFADEYQASLEQPAPAELIDRPFAASN